MKSRALLYCAFAGILLAATVTSASSTVLRSAKASHYFRGHMVRHATAAVHYRKTAYRHFPRAAALRNAGSSSGGLMSGIASVYSGERTANGEFASAKGLTA